MTQTVQPISAPASFPAMPQAIPVTTPTSAKLKMSGSAKAGRNAAGRCSNGHDGPHRGFAGGRPDAAARRSETVAAARAAATSPSASRMAAVIAAITKGEHDGEAFDREY